MNVAIDYDNTYTLDPVAWNKIINILLEFPFCKEFKTALGDKCTIFVNDYKKWGRRDAHVFEWKSLEEFDLLPSLGENPLAFQ